MSDKRVLIAVMPFLALERPPLGPGLLKRSLERRGIKCDVRHFQFRFADLIGFELYQRLEYSTPTHDLAGEWLFTRALYGAEALPAERFEKYASKQSGIFYDPVFFAQIEHCRAVAVDFIEECAATIEPGRYDIVGFSSTFQENLASLATAKALKRREPHLKIVLGGSNCEDEMGVELHSCFPFIDYVCSGEADYTFAELVVTIREDREPSGIAGVAYRRNGELVRSDVPQQLVEEMDTLPIPDHSDFLGAYGRSTAKFFMKPQLTMETSRGCWWGQRHHCTFCGLNGLGMKYRSKSIGRAYSEINELVSTYGISSFFNTDNIVDMRYFSALFPMLAQNGVKVELYYESKANLKKEHLYALKRIGTNWIQPGIESLSSHVLQLMDKGITAIQNIQLLKWARELNMNVTWNVICGFPGERPEDYQQFARVVPAIAHLQPPASFAGFRMDRFSPIYKNPARFGLSNVQPYESYRLCYLVREESLLRIAYFFTYDSPVDRATADAINEAWLAIQEWRRNDGQGSLIGTVGSELLLILDTRPGYGPKQHLFHGKERAIYLAIDSARSPRLILETVRKTAPEFSWNEEEVTGVLQSFERESLVLREGDLYLALALLPVDETTLKLPESKISFLQSPSSPLRILQ